MLFYKGKKANGQPYLDQTKWTSPAAEDATDSDCSQIDGPQDQNGKHTASDGVFQRFISTINSGERGFGNMQIGNNNACIMVSDRTEK